MYTKIIIMRKIGKNGKGQFSNLAYAKRYPHLVQKEIYRFQKCKCS